MAGAGRSNSTSASPDKRIYSSKPPFAFGFSDQQTSLFMAAHIRCPRPGLRLPQDQIAANCDRCHGEYVAELSSYGHGRGRPQIHNLVPELWQIDEPHADYSS